MFRRKFKVPQQTVYDELTGLRIRFAVGRKGVMRLYLSGDCLEYGNRDFDFHKSREGIHGAGTGMWGVTPPCVLVKETDDAPIP